MFTYGAIQRPTGSVEVSGIENVMDKARYPAKRLKRFKWLIIGLSIFAITIGEFFHYRMGGSPQFLIWIWLLGSVAAFIVIEITFRLAENLQAQLDEQLNDSQLLARHQATLLQLNSKLAATLDVREICQIVLDALKDPLGYEHFDLYLFNEDGTKLYKVADTSEALQQARRSYSRASPKTTTPTDIVEPEPAQNDAHNGDRVTIPMQVGDKTVGKLSIEGKSTGSLNDEEFAVLVAIANHAAVAIENAKQFEKQRIRRANAEGREAELRVREQYLTQLNEITRTTLKSQDIDTLLQALADYLCKMFAADNALITLWNEVRDLPIPVAAAGPAKQILRTLQIEPGDLPLTASVLNSGRALVIEDTASSPYISARISAPLQSRSLLALPLIADEQKLGAAILTFRNRHAFTPRETRLGEQAKRVLCRPHNIALRNSSLYNRLLRLYCPQSNWKPCWGRFSTRQ